MQDEELIQLFRLNTRWCRKAKTTGSEEFSSSKYERIRVMLMDRDPVPCTPLALNPEPPKTPNPQP